MDFVAQFLVNLFVLSFDPETETAPRETAPIEEVAPVQVAQTQTYDGAWRYELDTRSASPTCQGFGSGSVEITNGGFSGHIAHNQDSFRVRGTVHENGLSRFSANGSFDSATFEVVFTGNNAKGSWSSKMSGCEGTIDLTRLP